MKTDYTDNRPWSITEIQGYLKKNVKESRYQHIMGVVEAARMLAMLYGENVHSAELAAYFHDALKDKNKEWLLSYIHRHNEDSGEGSAAWKTLHAQAGAIFAKEEGGINDDAILDAIRYHTTGRENMGLLEKIIFVADYIESGRNFDGVDHIRALASQDIDRAVLAGLNSSITHLKESDEHIMPLSLKAQSYYSELIRERTKNEQFNESN